MIDKYNGSTEIPKVPKNLRIYTSIVCIWQSPHLVFNQKDSELISYQEYVIASLVKVLDSTLDDMKMGTHRQSDYHSYFVLYRQTLLLRHWYKIIALYYVKSILTEISASRQYRRVLQKSKIIRIEFLSKWGMLQTSRYV